jgi:hypothetical protein
VEHKLCELLRTDRFVYAGLTTSTARRPELRKATRCQCLRSEGGSAGEVVKSPTGTFGGRAELRLPPRRRS